MNGKHFSAPRPPKQAPLKVDFLIVGGGISGLACAFALRRVGHRVTVLEKDINIDGDGTPGGIRLPPNASKILFDWGLKEELRKIGSKTDAITMFTFEGIRLGKHVWSEEVLKETRGEFIYASHYDFRRLMYRAAVSAGAKVRFNARVHSIDPDSGTVTLASGEVLEADIIVGADGQFGLSRREFLEETKPDTGTLLMYHTTIPKKLMMRDPDLAYFWEFKDNVLHMYGWFGNGQCLLGFPVGGTHTSEALAVYAYVPPDGTTGTWSDRTSKEKMLASFKNPEPRLKKLLKLATQPRSLPMQTFVELEDWVHDSGRMVLIGEAAHPLPVGAIQSTALSLEDGGVLAKLFSHLRSEDQIPSFLYAFQDLRSPRCSFVAGSEAANMYFMTLPPGEMQAGRDMMFQAKDAKGLNCLEPSEEDGTLDRWEDIKYVFGYDAEDDADNWWVQWGLLAMRAKGADMLSTGPGAFTVQIDQQIRPVLRGSSSKTFRQIKR